MLPYERFIDLVVISFLAAAVLNDLKRREVPNWVNYGLIILGVGFATLRSIALSDISFVVFSLVGVGFAFGLSALMFYLGQWGGGDSKLLIGLGSVLGLPLSTAAPFIVIEGRLLSFLANLVFVSFFYAIAFGVFIALKNPGKFSKAFKQQLESKRLLRKLILAVCLLGFLVVIILHDLASRLVTLLLLTAVISGFYLSVMAKALEKSSMLKQLSPLKLTEGDWIAKDVVVNGKRICGPKDLGVDKRQIRQLVSLYNKKKIRTVLVKEGIPFAPSFLIAYVVTMFFGNVFVMLLRQPF